MFSCCKSLPQVFTLLYANPANRKWGLSREVKQLPLQSMLYYCYYKAAKATRAVSSKRFVLFTMLQVPKPISWVHKKKQETGPWSVIQFFCLNSEAAFTQLLDIVFFISAAELRGHAMLCCTASFPIPSVARHLAINLKTSPRLDYLGRPVRAVKTRQSNLARRFSVPSPL